MPWLEAPGHSQASLAHTLVGHCSFLLGLGPQKVLFVPSKSLFTHSCGRSVIKSHWPSKSDSLGDLISFAGFPGCEICCGPQNLKQCKNFFGKIVLQFAGCLLSGSMVGLTCCISQACCNQSPCPCSRPLLILASEGDMQTLKEKSGSVSMGFLGYGVYEVLFEPLECLWRV